MFSCSKFFDIFLNIGTNIFQLELKSNNQLRVYKKNRVYVYEGEIDPTDVEYQNFQIADKTASMENNKQSSSISALEKYKPRYPWVI